MDARDLYMALSIIMYSCHHPIAGTILLIFAFGAIERI